MFGAIIYIPVFAQGVIGVNATNSGLILLPLMLGLIVIGIVTGQLITRTGRYKGVHPHRRRRHGRGLWLLTRLDHTATQGELTLAMIVLGVGLGFACSSTRSSSRTPRQRATSASSPPRPSSSATSARQSGSRSSARS